MKISFYKFVLIFTLLFTCNTGYTAESPEKEEESATTEPLSLTETYNLTNTLPKKLFNLRKQVNDLTDTKVLFVKIQKLDLRVEELEWE